MDFSDRTVCEFIYPWLILDGLSWMESQSAHKKDACKNHSFHCQSVNWCIFSTAQYTVSPGTSIDTSVKCSVVSTSCLPVTPVSVKQYYPCMTWNIKLHQTVPFGQPSTDLWHVSPISPAVKLHIASENTGPSINKQESRWYWQHECPSTLLTSLNNFGWVTIFGR